VLAVDLKTGPDLLRALPKYLGALRALNSDLVVDHEIHLKADLYQADLKLTLKLPHEALKIAARGADKEDRAAR